MACLHYQVPFLIITDKELHIGLSPGQPDLADTDILENNALTAALKNQGFTGRSIQGWKIQGPAGGACYTDHTLPLNGGSYLNPLGAAAPDCKGLIPLKNHA